MDNQLSTSTTSLPGTPTNRSVRVSRNSTYKLRSRSAPPDFRVNDHMELLVEAFKRYYTSHPITLYPENSQVVMLDLHQKLMTVPKRIIAPDGYIPNSKIRSMLPLATPSLQVTQTPATDLASQRFNLEQLIKRYLSDERTRDTLSSLTILKDVALLRIATPGIAAERIRGEIMTNLAIEIEGLLEQPCEQILEEDHVEVDEAARMEKSAKMHKFARQITKQAVQKHFEQKVQESLERRGPAPKAEEEEPFTEEEDQQNERSTSRSIRTPTGWRQEEDLIDRLEKDTGEEVQKRLQLEQERTLPYEFVRVTLDKMAAEWGGMARVMVAIHGGLKKKQPHLDRLDAFLKSRECRVGMINSMLSPAWAHMYLSHMLGSSRVLLEHLDTLLDPETSPDVLNGLRMQMINLLGTGQRLDQFCKEFNDTRTSFENILNSRGMPKDAAKNLVYEALCDNADAHQRIGQWIAMPNPEEVIHALKMCNKDRIQALSKALSSSITIPKQPETPQPPMSDMNERSKESADASLLAQLDLDARRVMQYDAREFEDEPGTPDQAETQLKVQLAPSGKQEQRREKPILLTSPSSSDVSGSLRDSTLEMKESSPVKEPKKRKGKPIKMGIFKTESEMEQRADEAEPVPEQRITTETKEHKLLRKMRTPGSSDQIKDDSFDEYNRGMGMADYESTSRQLQPKTRTQAPASVRRVKRLQKIVKPDRKGEDEDEQVTEPPDTAGSLEDRAPEDGSMTPSSEHTEYDLSTVEHELMLLDEERDEVRKALQPDDQITRDQTGITRESEQDRESERTVYPDPAFLRGLVKRFVANKEPDGDLIIFEDVETTPDALEEFLRKTIASRWYTSSESQLKKEVVAVEIIRLAPNLKDLSDLREAEIVLILLKRQFGISMNCQQYILKVADKLFFKHLQLLKLSRKSKHSARYEAFARALFSLSIMSNFGVDVAEQLNTLEAEYKRPMSQVHTEPRKSKIEKKRHSKPENLRDGRIDMDQLMIPTDENLKKQLAEEDQEELAVQEALEGEALSPEEEQQRRSKRLADVASKLRAKTQERIALDRLLARDREKQIDIDSRDTSSARSALDEGGEQEEDTTRPTSTSRLDRKKKALREKDTETSSSHEGAIDELEEEISLAAIEAKRRRAMQSAEAEAKSVSKSEPIPYPEGELDQPGPWKPHVAEHKFEAKGKRAVGEAQQEEEEYDEENYDEDQDREKISETASESEERERADRRRGRMKSRKSIRRFKHARKQKLSEQELLLKFPTMQRIMTREQISTTLRDFLEQQVETGAWAQSPSVSLRALAAALQNPETAAKAQEVILAFEQELGLDEKDPAVVVKQIKDQLDMTAGGKMASFNKMVNLLSILLALDSSEAEDSPDSQESLPNEIELQRKQLLAALVDDITSQLKYEYSILNELSPGQRAVWMALETQADTMRECCEKIGYLVSSNAMTPELASFISSVFIMDLLDYESMLKKDDTLTEAEQRTIYRQAMDLLEVLGWFNVKPSGVSETMGEFSYLMEHEPILDRPPPPGVREFQLDIVLPASYMTRASNAFFADFATVNFIEDEPRIPLEHLYASGSSQMRKETPKLSDTSRGRESMSSGPVTMLKIMTRRLSEIKRVFRDPIRSMDPRSPLTRIGTKLMRGLRNLTAMENMTTDKSSSTEQLNSEKVVAYETGRVPITNKSLAVANALKLRRKTMPSFRRRLASKVAPLHIQTAELDLLAELAGKRILKSRSSQQSHVKDRSVVSFPIRNVMTLTPEEHSTQRPHPSVMRTSPTAPAVAVVAKVGSVTDVRPISSPLTERVRTDQRRAERESPSLMKKRTKESDLDEETSKRATRVKRSRPAKAKLGKTRELFRPGDTVIQAPSAKSLQSILKQPYLDDSVQQPGQSQFYPRAGFNLTPTTYHRVGTTSETGEPRSPAKQLIIKSEEADRLSLESTRASGMEYTTMKASGVWTWLDSMLASKSRATIRSQSLFQTLKIEPRYRAPRKLSKGSGERLINRFENKAARLQYLVKNFEEADVWSPTTDQEEVTQELQPLIEDRIGKAQVKEMPPGWGATYFSSTQPGLQKAEQIRRRLEAKRHQARQDQHRYSVSESTQKSRRSTKFKPDTTSLERFAANLDTATKYLQSVVPPGYLTQLLNEIQGDDMSQEALNALEDALLLAATKARTAEDVEWLYIRSTPRPSTIPPSQWRILGLTKVPNKLPPDSFQLANIQGVHCRYAYLAQKGFHKPGLSIAAHLARMDLVECINKSIQQRAYKRIQTSMKECLKKVIE